MTINLPRRHTMVAAALACAAALPLSGAAAADVMFSSSRTVVEQVYTVIDANHNDSSVDVHAAWPKSLEIGS